MLNIHNHFSWVKVELEDNEFFVSENGCNSLQMLQVELNIKASYLIEGT